MRDHTNRRGRLARRIGLLLALSVPFVQPSWAQGEHNPSALTLDLNIPAFRLELRDSGRVVRRFRVAVGLASYPTPIGVYAVDYLVWNPSWTPPKQAWARNQRPQPPSARNWMGRVKMHVVDLVFLHGSPFVGSMGSAASHACVRMTNEDAIALARTLGERAGLDVSPSLLDSLLADETRTREMRLLPSVPITIRYDVAVLRSDSLFILPDIYQRAPGGARSRALEVLRSAGIDSAAIDDAALRALLQRGRRQAAGAPVPVIAPLEPRAW
jgi:murein L,D-transpeptidase YcbB/YkuD